MKRIKTSFGKKKVYQNQKTRMVQNIFTNISKKYNLMNDLMSFGTHHLWKKRLVEIMNIQRYDKIIEIGSGTGDIENIIQNNYYDTIITSVDLNLNMLQENLKNKKIYKKNTNLINCNAEHLPFKNDLFDKYVISFCLRNVTFVDKTLSEAFRVLKPGGIFYCLEFSTPHSSLLNNIYLYYKAKIIPKIGNFVTNNKTAYEYLEESISQFPHQEVLLNKLNSIGFVNTSIISLFNGIVSIHVGYKI